jgi:hypothetical protein
METEKSLNTTNFHRNTMNLIVLRWLDVPIYTSTDFSLFTSKIHAVTLPKFTLDLINVQKSYSKNLLYLLLLHFLDLLQAKFTHKNPNFFIKIQPFSLYPHGTQTFKTHWMCYTICPSSLPEQYYQEAL